MRPSVILAVLAAALASFALAQGPAESTSVEVGRQFGRDERLLNALVEGGLELAGESDPLKRAGICNEIVDQLGQELLRSAAGKDLPRADPLGRHIQALLARGVVANVNLARFDSGPGRAAELDGIWARTDAITRPLAEGLRNAAATNGRMETIYKAVLAGREKVNYAVKGKRPPRTKGATPGG
jgi:hypothetical protein